MPVKTIFIVSTSVAIIPIFLHYLHERNFSNEILNNVLNQISKSKVFNFFYNKYYFGIISGIAIFSAAAIIDTKCFTKKNKIPDTN